MIKLLDEASAATTASQTTSLTSSSWFFWVMLVVVVIVFYFLVIRPQKKQEKQQNELRNSLSVGDEVTTIGGIVGVVVKVKDDMFTIITSKERTRLSFQRFALRSIDRHANAPEKTDNTAHTDDTQENTDSTESKS